MHKITMDFTDVDNDRFIFTQDFEGEMAIPAETTEQALVFIIMSYAKLLAAGVYDLESEYTRVGDDFNTASDAGKFDQ